MPATAEDEAIYQELCEVLLRHEKAGVAPARLLALNAKISGRLIACMDQTMITPAMAMEIVSLNLAAGNAEMVANLMASKGSA